MNVWKTAAELIRAGQAGALATVARVRGSTPVPAGTKMLVGAEGRLIGSVGGGCVEADVIGAALVAQASQQPTLLTHHLNADLAGDLGLSCGGTVDVFVEPLIADERYVHVLDAAAAADSGLVRTARNWTGDGAVKTFEARPRAGLSGSAATLTRDGRFMEERLTQPPRVFIFGAGHVGTAIARAAEAAGFRVVVIDDRADYADASRFTGDVLTLVGDVNVALERYPLTSADAIVIATRGHRNDAVILERVATSPAGYVGLLGSKRKKIVVTKGLTAAGVPAKSLERVRVPVGLAIGAVTPEEIAVSVVAELIAWRRS